MLSALGVDTDRLFAVTYAIGAALAGLAGVVAAPVLGLQPGMDVEALVLSLIVVVVGGLGTLGGAQVGAAFQFEQTFESARPGERRLYDSAGTDAPAGVAAAVEVNRQVFVKPVADGANDEIRHL